MLMTEVTYVRPIGRRKLRIRCVDGVAVVNGMVDVVRGRVDMDCIIARYTGVFAPLLDDHFFRKVRVNRDLGTITWPNGAVIHPDILYAYALDDQDGTPNRNSWGGPADLAKSLQDYALWVQEVTQARGHVGGWAMSNVRRHGRVF